MSGIAMVATTYVTIDRKDYSPGDPVTVKDTAYAKRLVRDGNARYADDKKPDTAKTADKSAPPTP